MSADTINTRSFNENDSWLWGPMRRRKRFGEILVEAKVVDEQTLNKALLEQKETGWRLGHVLEHMGVVTERDIAVALARQFGFKTVSNIAKATFSQKLLALIDGKTARNKMIFPLKYEGTKLYLAMVNPLDIETIDSITFNKGVRIVPCVTTPTEIQSAVNQHYFNIIQEVELAAYDPHAVLELGQESNRQADEKPDGKWTILVVDDQDQERSALKTALQREDYALLEASSGAAGLKMALQEKPHLIVTDTEMPRMDGSEMFQSFQAVQANLNFKNIPMIALSANSSPEEEAKLLGMGYFDFIAKPVDPVRLAARVKHALRINYGASPPPR